MENYDYLIIGGGMTGDSAVEGIREIDDRGRIGVISSESDPPYDRPPLSKDLWKGNMELKDVWRGTPEKGVDLYLKCTALGLDPNEKLVYDDGGRVFHYGKLLLATGGTPRRLPGGLTDVIYYRTLESYRRLRKLADERNDFCVVGGGFIGSEIAAALIIAHKNVTMIFPGRGLCSRVLPEDLSSYVTSFYKERGVTVLPGERVSSVEKRSDNVYIRTGGGRDLRFDAVVAGIGIIPCVELALNAGLSVENGILVDEYLRTSNPDIYAAGDVANFISAYEGGRMRVEHEDNANAMGKRAGRNMAGESTTYDHQPYFYSDLFELGYEAVGELDSNLQTVVDWKEEYRKGVVYYLNAGLIKGILLWNIFGQVDNARGLIAERRQHRPDDLVGLLPKPKAKDN